MEEELRFFLNKMVFIKTKDGYMYRGSLEKIFPTSIILNDIKNGETLLYKEQLASVALYDETKSKRTY